MIEQRKNNDEMLVPPAKSLFLASADKLRLLLRTERVETDDLLCGVLRRTEGMILDFWRMASSDGMTTDPSAYHRHHLLLVSSLQHTRHALHHFHRHQGSNRTAPEYVDLLGAVEYGEWVVPRLYMSVLVASILLEDSTGGDMGGVLGDLGGRLDALRTPLPALHLRSFALLSTTTTTKSESSNLVDFYLTVWRGMVQDWCRFRQQHHSDDRDTELVDLLVCPIAMFIQNLPVEEYATRVCPLVMGVLADCEDPLVQSILFKSLLPRLPPSHLSSTTAIDPILSALASFPDQSGLESSILLLVTTILDGAVSGDVAKALWEGVKPILESKTIIHESWYIQIASPFLSTKFPLLFEDIFETLNRLVSDKNMDSWQNLLHHQTRTAPDPTLLLHSPSFLAALTRNTIRDPDTSILLASRSDSVGQPLVELLSSIFSKLVVEEHEKNFLSRLDPLQTWKPWKDEDAALSLISLLQEASLQDPENLAINYFIRPLSESIASSTLMDCLEQFRDTRRASIDCHGELSLLFGPDAPSYQFIAIMTSQASHPPPDDTDGSFVYARLSKAIMTLEKGMIQSATQAKAIALIIDSLSGPSCLRQQDLQVLLLHLGKICQRQLDIDHRSQSLLSLLPIIAKCPSEELVDQLLPPTLSSLNTHKPGPLLALLSHAILLFSSPSSPLKDAMLKHALPLNALFWELDSNCPAEDRPRYAQLWAAWTEAVPAQQLALADIDTDDITNTPMDDETVETDGTEDGAETADYSDPADTTNIADALLNLQLDSDPSIYQ